jgi:hypothetical protein
MENDNNVMALFAQQGSALPAFIKDATPSALTQVLAGSDAVRRLGIGGSVFRLLLGRQELAVREERSMNIIIVAAAPAFARTYYVTQFDADAEPTSPDCWSDDGKLPSENATNPQATACMRCPRDRDGSGTNGQGKACRFSARLAIALENDIEGGLVSLSVPAASIFGDGHGRYSALQEYARKLAGFNISLEKVLTEVRFDTFSKVTYPRVLFQAVRPLTPAEYAAVQELQNTDLTPYTGPRKFSSVKMLATAAGAAELAATPASDDVDEDAPEPAPAPAPAPKRTKRATPAAEESTVAPPPPPTVRREATPEPTPSSDDKADVLASLLNKWADDTE